MRSEAKSCRSFLVRHSFNEGGSEGGKKMIQILSLVVLAAVFAGCTNGPSPSVAKEFSGYYDNEENILYIPGWKLDTVMPVLQKWISSHPDKKVVSVAMFVCKTQHSIPCGYLVVYEDRIINCEKP